MVWMTEGSTRPKAAPPARAPGLASLPQAHCLEAGALGKDQHLRDTLGWPHRENAVLTGGPFGPGNPVGPWGPLGPWGQTTVSMRTDIFPAVGPVAPPPDL